MIIKKIAVSKSTWDRICDFALLPMDTTEATFHANGMVEFPIASETHKQLMRISPDAEMAIIRLLDAGKKQTGIN